MEKQYIYPFTAVVGQDEMKLALILNMINPKLNGVLIKGEKGTAKSTVVRALAEILPTRDEIDGCAFHCGLDEPNTWCNKCKNDPDRRKNYSKKQMKVVNLPVSATEDRVVGSIDIEKALKTGEKVFEPGILADANRNILYVDEINLLDDHIVDLLLDCAAMGVNSIEREGISYSHPSRFVLVGTMNPEEGELRPQLLDRFGLVVSVSAESNIDNRIEIVKRRMEFEENPKEFCLKYKDEQKILGEKIIHAKKILSGVTYKDNVLKLICQIAVDLDVDGHRSDITMLKTACTNAAFEGRNYISKSDLITASRLVLPHRMRKRPFDDMVLDMQEIEETIQKSDLPC